MTDRAAAGDSDAGHTAVATANVLCTLRADEARDVLNGVLDLRPDLIGLQEWTVSRHALLRESGAVRWSLPRGVPATSLPPTGAGYLWVTPVLGGCPVGLRADRFELLDARSRLLGGVGWCDRTARRVPVVPARIATVALLRDRHVGRTVGLVNFHLTPGVQAGGRYRDDRPRLVARHRTEVRRLGRLVADLLTQGHTVYAVGDSNLDGLRLPGLTSAWEGRDDAPGTFGHRKIDDVHGPGPADSVTLVSSASDHQAVVVRRADLV